MANTFARSATGALMAAGFILSGRLSAAPLKTAPEPNTVAQRIWGALLTRCPSGNYFYAGSSLDAGGMLSDVQIGENPVLEFKGVTFHLVPIRVTDAERANGIAYRGRMSMIAHLYREAGGTWEDGPDLQRRNIGDMLGRVLADANGEFFGAGAGGSITIQLVKFRGLWAFARGSTDFNGSFGAGGSFQAVGDFVKAAAPHYSCKDGKVILPAGARSADASNQ